MTNRPDRSILIAFAFVLGAALVLAGVYFGAIAPSMRRAA